MKRTTLFLVVFLLAGCQTQQQTRSTPEATAVPTPTTASQPTPSLTAIEVTAEIVTPKPTPTTAVPTPQPPPSGELSAITEPLLIDGERGRMYASAQVNAQPKTVVLDTKDGRLLAIYDIVGNLALDRAHNRLIVDQAETGVTILDAQTDAVIDAVPLPPVEDDPQTPFDDPPDPQINPTTGLIYAFRDRTVYIIDPNTGAIETTALNVEGQVCGESTGPEKIWRSHFDLTNQKLYLAFVTWMCTPHVGVTIVAYDAPTMTEDGRYETPAAYQAVPLHNNLYGTSTGSSAVGTTFWARNRDEAWYEMMSSGYSLSGIVADWERQLIYEAIGKTIRVIDPDTREVLSQVDMALLDGNGRLAGHDPISDNLYFLTGDGQLRLWPTNAFFATTE